MDFKFKNLSFCILNNKIYLSDFGNFKNLTKTPFCEVQIAGENKPTHKGIKLVNSSEGEKLCYVSHKLFENSLEIIQKTKLISVKTLFESFGLEKGVRITTEYENISDDDIILEEASSFLLSGIGKNTLEDINNLHLTSFSQSHHIECQPLKKSFASYGLFGENSPGGGQKKICFSNIGSWSTKEALPQGIIENLNDLLFFQIESPSSWHYEISDNNNELYLYLGGGNLSYGNWSKQLKPQEKYKASSVALFTDNSLNGLLSEITVYRRKICGLSEKDKHLPSIFNEYMHLSWDSPSEEKTKIYAPVAAKTGVEYYVIDCGWHNEEPGEVIYPYVGQWKESKKRFPGGIRKTTDYIRSLGMKAGLWIEPEIVGCDCKEMLDFYDDECFVCRFGKKVAVNNRYFLDFRNEKVKSYMTETIRRMVEDYGADYIKFDYNQDMGTGTDVNALTTGDGIEKTSDAFLEWFLSVKEKFPKIIFEACASGGMRMDYKTLSCFSLVSTSDQINYLKYPYIAANILSAVIPEQAAVWSYPVGEADIKEVTDNRIVMNMVNSFLGRMHLASHLELLNEHQFNLVKEGVEFYNKLTEHKIDSVPYMPWGFTDFFNDKVVSGFRKNNKIFLAVWNFSDEGIFDIELESEIENAIIGYPSRTEDEISFEGRKLFIKMKEKNSALFLITDLK